MTLTTSQIARAINQVWHVSMNQTNMGVILVHPPKVKSLPTARHRAFEYTRANMTLNMPPKAGSGREGTERCTALPLAFKCNRSAFARYMCAECFVRKDSVGLIGRQYLLLCVCPPFITRNLRLLRGKCIIVSHSFGRRD